MSRQGAGQEQDVMRRGDVFVLPRLFSCPGEPWCGVPLRPARRGSAERCPWRPDTADSLCTSVQRVRAQAPGRTQEVTVRVEVEEGSSDQMQPPGALPEPGDSQVQQPKARGEDRPLEEAGERETPGPKDELPHVTKEEPPPNPEPGPYQPF
ncbi:hypothetical protein Y1Q_0019915 [Alligator mississippiensis]|uniref:Uncharacterized protein n=1 Tax=Alligator mississippiensis TaxID=8496 RepID=A0A151N002_ALLMI|nr:hypothetical protein Y1Q_0019915 [Alligator mississippiensis]